MASWMAPAGHAETHAPQAVQTWALPPVLFRRAAASVARTRRCIHGPHAGCSRKALVPIVPAPPAWATNRNCRPLSRGYGTTSVAKPCALSASCMPWHTPLAWSSAAQCSPPLSPAYHCHSSSAATWWPSTIAAWAIGMKPRKNSASRLSRSSTETIHASQQASGFVTAFTMSAALSIIFSQSKLSIYLRKILLSV